MKKPYLGGGGTTTTGGGGSGGSPIPPSSCQGGGGGWTPIPPSTPPVTIVGELGDNVVGDFPELTNQIDWANSIDETGLANLPCLKSILTALKTAPSFYNTMNNFTGVNATGHIKFGTTSDGVATTTTNLANQRSTIRFNVNYLSSSTKSFALITFVHEMIHANFARLLMRMNDPAPTDIYKDVVKHFGAVKFSEMNEHDYMANVFIPYLKSVFEELDGILNLGPHYLPGTTTPDPHYFDALVWSGLQEVQPGDGTAAWYDLSPATQAEYTQIIGRAAQQGSGCN